MKRRLLILAAAACSHPGSRPALPTALVPAAVTLARPTSTAALPATPAGQQLGWVLDRLANSGRVDEAAITVHFAPSFLAKLPAAQLVAVFERVAQRLARPELGALEVSGPRHLLVHLTALGERYTFDLETDAAGLIADLLVSPEPMASVDEAVAKLKASAARTQMLVAELEHGTCRPLHAYNETDELAIGSTLKLYVLLAVADRIAAGTLGWDQELVVRDDWKSLPSGVTQDEPAGTRHSVKLFAERMISISDNTATDHLLYTAGRHRVEAAMTSARHSAPARNVPFFSTRELFWFKLGMPADEIAAYQALDVTARRRFVDGLVGKHPVFENEDGWSNPRYIDTLEWFASSNDLCNAMAALQARAKAEGGEPIFEVLGKNPGLSARRGWKYVGFKGGSEPGVLSATWLLERDDDRWFVVTMTLNDSMRVIEEARVAIGQSMIALLLKESARAAE